MTDDLQQQLAECAAMRVVFQRFVETARTTGSSSAFRELAEMGAPDAIKTAGKALLDELLLLRQVVRALGVTPCEWCGQLGCGLEVFGVLEKTCPGPPPGRRRWGVIEERVGLDPMWVEPLEVEDTTMDPDDPDERTALFESPTAARAGIARRSRYVVRELPVKEKP